MAHSREYTHWHLTPTGWVSGDSKWDSGQRVNKPEPANTLKTVIYTEEMSSSFSKLVKDEQVVFVHSNKALVAETEAKYPFTFRID